MEYGHCRKACTVGGERLIREHTRGKGSKSASPIGEPGMRRLRVRMPAKRVEASESIVDEFLEGSEVDKLHQWVYKLETELCQERRQCILQKEETGKLRYDVDRLRESVLMLLE